MMNRISAVELSLPNTHGIPVRVFANEAVRVEKAAVDELSGLLELQETVNRIAATDPDFFDTPNPGIVEVAVTPDFHKGFRKEDILQAQRALQALNHRGPDGEGICLIDTHSGKSWTYQTKDTPADIVTEINADSYPEGSADLLLAQRRLSIFDLSSRGYQPMRDQKAT
jgi:hypothetical protein